VALPQPGDPVPPLVLQDAVGRPATLPEGEALFAFFKTTCATSELAWPYLERIRRVAAEGELRLIGISQDGPDETRSFQERTGARLDVLFDPPPWNASAALGLQTVPTFLLVGADGRAKQIVVGFQKEAMTRLAAVAAGDGPAPELFRPDEDVPVFRPG
jgi:peroxiredoxin